MKHVPAREVRGTICRAQLHDVRVELGEQPHLADIDQRADLAVAEPIKQFTPRSVEAIQKDVDFIYFDAKQPTLNQFCLRFDWPSTESLYYYSEVRQCLPNEVENTRIKRKCGGSLEDLQQMVFDLDQTETLAQCVYPMLRCNMDIKNYIALSSVMNKVSPDVVYRHGGLHRYVRHLTGDGRSDASRYALPSVMLLMILSSISYLNL